MPFGLKFVLAAASAGGLLVTAGMGVLFGLGAALITAGAVSLAAAFLGSRALSRGMNANG